MKQSLQKDTLAYQFGVRPGVLHRDMGQVNVVDVVASLNKFMSCQEAGHFAKVPFPEKPKGNPERDGIIFYMLNHAVSIVRQRVHPYERLGNYLVLVEEYHRQLAIRSARMFFYMLLICTRESRHDKSGYTSPAWIEMRKKYGEAIYSFHQSIKGESSSGAADTLKKSPPSVPLGTYTKFLVDVFYKGSYQAGYGGKAWGKVADVLCGYVNGDITAEMMMDTAFTLCHNNGPIFNKGMLFDGYTNEIYKILDVQRSGQIPQMVANGESNWAQDQSIMQLWSKCQSIIGDAFSGHVDWFLVEELGALHNYKNLKDAQVQKYGYPSKFKAKVEAEKLKKEMEAAEAAKIAKSMVEIMPGLKVKKIEVR